MPRAPRAAGVAGVVATTVFEMKFKGRQILWPNRLQSISLFFKINALSIPSFYGKMASFGERSEGENLSDKS